VTCLEKVMFTADRTTNHQPIDAQTADQLSVPYTADYS